VEALIQAEGLTKQFDGNLAVDDLSLEVHPGEIFALVGPDGAGKTTAIRLLCGALQLDSGRVRLAGYDLGSDLEQARAQIGYFPQRFSLYDELTVIENLRFFAEVRGMSAKEWRPRSEEILEFVGLLEFANRRADALSGGMKQKLGLAAALVHRPQILLLDEPTSGVDAVTRQAFWQLIIRILPGGVAVLISTPYMDEAIRCSRVGFMTQGRLLIEGTPEALTDRLDGRIIEVVARSPRVIGRIAQSQPQVEDVQMLGDRLHLRVAQRKGREAIKSLKRRCKVQGVEIERIKLIRPSLEDVFIDLLEDDLIIPQTAKAGEE
jgi:ABC-2 type transport system ATP-binding protein